MVTDSLDFRGMLLEEVLPFWERSVDHEYGGFITEIDARGERHGSGEKHLVMQTRMIYSYSLGYRLTQNPTYLAHARQGVEFFRAFFYDREYGGWFRTTNRAGEPINREKWPYGIAFAAYSLADYYRTSGDREVLRLAVETFDLHWEKAWDPVRGGIAWNLARDWSPLDLTKRIDSMLHTMEAASSLFAATGERRYLTCLSQLGATIMHHTYDPVHGCTHEWFNPDWTEALDRTRGLINYGHIAEAAWFTSAVAAHTGDTAMQEFGRSLLAFVLRHGWDQTHGGIYSYGHADGRPVDTNKVWWMQAELLGGLSLAYRQTGDVLYRDWLCALARFIFEKQRDATMGEWHAAVYADGTIHDGRKGFSAKAAYHVAQALHHAAANLAAATNPIPPKVTADWSTLAL